MKKIFLILLFLLLYNCSFSQDTIVTAVGDKYSYYFNTNDFSQFKENKSKIEINLFVSSEGNRSVWGQNISLRKNIFIQLLNYIDNIPELSVGAKAYDEHILNSFEVYSNDNKNADYMPMNKFSNKDLDIIKVQQEIKEFFK